MALLDDMIKTIEQTSNEIIDEQGKNFSKQIKKYAQQFMNIINEDKKALKEMEDMLKTQQTTIRAIQQASTKSTYEWRTQIQNRHLMTKKDYYRQIVTAALKFQTQINELLNQKVELVYVYQDEKNNPTLYTIDENSLSSALDYQNNKGKIAGRFKESYNFLSYLNNLTKYELYQNFNLQYFNYTYKDIIWRFNRGHAKGTDLILWLNPHFGSYRTKWLKASVGNQGDIKEAYASIILDRTINSIKLFNDEKLDNNVHSFMEQVAKVDTESGLLKGDVTVGQIEYAIKGVSASTLGLTQIIKVAQSIIDKTNYLKEDLQKQKEQFHKIAGTRNHIKKVCQQQLKEYINHVGEKFVNIIQNKNSLGMNVLVNFQPGDVKSIMQQLQK